MIKKIGNKVLVAAAVAGAVLQGGVAHAAFTMPTGSTADLGPIEAWLGVAVVGYLALFGYRKFVKTSNRS